MTQLLRDPLAHQFFERDGFVVVRLLSPDQVAALLAVYNQTVAENEITGLYESSRHKPYTVNREVNEAIREQVRLASEKIFLPCQIYGGTFMVKSHKDSDVLPLHQDWSVVEEARYATLFLWCPLVDVSPRNGGIFVLPGSHRWFRTLRSGGYPSNRYVLPPQLHSHVQDVSLHAGEALLYSDALFHGSHANNGSEDRIVVTARVTEEKAPLVYFQKFSEKEVDVYRASPEFYLTHIGQLAKGLMPDGVARLSRRSYEHVPITNATLEEKIREHYGSKGEANMKPLFKNPALQTAFEKDGFVVIDLIGPNEIEELIHFYGSLQNAPAPQHGFQVSLDDPNPDFVRCVTEKLVAMAAPSAGNYFENHKVFTASFVTKGKNASGFVPPHQDWTFVDESEFWSATVWCPLVDVNAENGALALLKGSHRFYDHVRPSPSPQYAPPFKDQLFTIFPYMQIVELRAGQAIVFHNKTLHASPPNLKNETRLAFGIGITHRDAQLRHYYLLPDHPEVMEGYEVSPEFFFSYNNARLAALHEKGLRPKGLNSIGTFAVRSRQYTTSELVEKMSSAGGHFQDALLARVAGLADAYSARPSSTGQPASLRGNARPLWKVYTPANIYREIRYRLAKPSA